MVRLLFIGAHPDDETFLAAGTLAKYAAAGVHVAIVCATRGERGATGDLCSIEELPRVREAEVREAGRVLGASEVEVLPFVDQLLASAPADDIRRRIVQIIRRIRPETVITFDPEGGNQHPDHIAISRFGADGISAAADGRWYPEAGKPHVVGRLLWQSPLHVFDLGRMPDLQAQPGFDFLIDIGPFRDRKEAALRAHRTQWPGLHKIFFEKGKPEETMRWEAFRVAYGPRPANPPADDLFKHEVTSVSTIS